MKKIHTLSMILLFTAFIFNTLPLHAKNKKSQDNRNPKKSSPIPQTGLFQTNPYLIFPLLPPVKPGSFSTALHLNMKLFIDIIKTPSRKNGIGIKPDGLTNPDALSLDWGCQPLFNLTFQKLAKKTSFCFNPDGFTNDDAKSLMGWGRRPPDLLAPLKARIPKKRFGRTALMGVGHFIYATSSYWIRQDVMKIDWEYHWNWKDQKRRLFFMDGLRFDSNTFEFNWTHSIAGAMYYNYARANRSSLLGSFLFDLGASYFWEFAVEFKEVISINDMITTTVGGFSIGESLFQVGRFFRSQKPTLLNKIARFISNPVLSLNELLDGRKYKNQYVIDTDCWNDFRFFIGPRFDTFRHSETGSLFQVGFDTQLNLIPGYGEPGTTGKAIKQTAFTEFNIGGALSKKGLQEFNIFAKSVLFGYLKQDIRPAKTSSLLPGQNPTTPGNDTGPTLPQQDMHDYNSHGSDPGDQGYSFFLGVGTCFDVMNKNSPAPAAGMQETPIDSPEKEDRYCIINLLGPTVDFSLFGKDLKLRLVADAYGDFALIHSHAFKKYSELYDVGPTKCTLTDHGYYYALGITLSSMLQLNYSHLELKGILKYHYFDSVEGMDRYQKEVADDFDLKDHRWIYNLSLGYRIPNTPVQLVLGVERWDRKGYIMDFSRESTERRSYFQVKYLF